MYKKLKKKIREIHDYRTLKHSGVFDREYYLKNNLDVARSCLDPIKHYIRYGWREGRNPNSLFDTVRYLKSFPEIVNSDLNPLCHYILNDSEYNCFVQPNRLHGKCKFPDFPPKPMVSIVIVNLNGEEHLRDLLISINLQDYKNYELVFVDNNSSDNSINIVNEYFPKAKIIINNENLGFADGNNIGFNNSVGELVAFINNDTKVDSHWLSSLVSALEKHSDAAVACPKILFWTKFLPVSIRCSKEIELDYHTFFEHLDYKKAFIQSEHHPENGSLKIKNRTFDILIPCLGDKIKFRIRGTGNSISSDVEIFLSQKRIGSYQIKGTSWDELLLEVDLSAVSSTGSYVINNAGSTETSSGDPCDRGYGELDNGKYNTVESIPLLCGCSFVIRRIGIRSCQSGSQRMAIQYSMSLKVLFGISTPRPLKKNQPDGDILSTETGPIMNCFTKMTGITMPS
jgi:glycosyltransferase involved in cell wall biosynthesis